MPSGKIQPVAGSPVIHANLRLSDRVLFIGSHVDFSFAAGVHGNLGKINPLCQYSLTYNSIQTHSKECSYSCFWRWSTKCVNASPSPPLMWKHFYHLPAAHGDASLLLCPPHLRLDHFDGLIPFDFKTEPTDSNSKYLGESLAFVTHTGSSPLPVFVMLGCVAPSQ